MCFAKIMSDVRCLRTILSFLAVCTLLFHCTLAMWYFLTIHDTMLYPFVEFVRWKLRKERQTKQRQTTKRLALEVLENTTATPVETKKRSRIEENDEDVKR